MRPNWMVRHNLGDAIFNAYPYPRPDDAEVESFLGFALFDPQREHFYFFPDWLLIPGYRSSLKVITLGVECDAFLNPLVVFEYFDERSDFISRWQKVLAYRKFSSLRQYIVIVNSKAPFVEEHTRNGEQWEVRVLADEQDHVHLFDGKTIPLDQIFTNELEGSRP